MRCPTQSAPMPPAQAEALFDLGLEAADREGDEERENRKAPHRAAQTASSNTNSSNTNSSHTKKADLSGASPRQSLARRVDSGPSGHRSGRHSSP